YPARRNLTLRLLEPLGAAEETAGVSPGTRTAAGAPRDGAGVAIDLVGVSVHAGGHAVLEEVSLAIPAGAHVAIVGASGAGKSSLVGVLLGWHAAASGTVHVD